MIHADEERSILSPFSIPLALDSLLPGLALAFQHWLIIWSAKVEWALAIFAVAIGVGFAGAALARLVHDPEAAVTERRRQRRRRRQPAMERSQERSQDQSHDEKSPEQRWQHPRTQSEQQHHHQQQQYQQQQSQDQQQQHQRMEPPARFGFASPQPSFDPLSPLFSAAGIRNKGDSPPLPPPPPPLEPLPWSPQQQQQDYNRDFQGWGSSLSSPVQQHQYRRGRGGGGLGGGPREKRD
jgi:hypothetical protein